jgi:outer membrane protein OmpU
MKRVLLGTTALATAGLLTGEASADTALKLGIQGFYRAAVGAVIGGDSATFGTGDAGRTSSGFRQEIRINFTGQTTLDNGLAVGVLAGLNAEDLSAVGSTETPTRQSCADFKGKFGNVRFGEANSALLTDCVGDPGNVTANFGVNSPNESFSNAGGGVTLAGGIHNATVGVAPLGSIGTCYGIESRGTKIAYFSPTMGGLTFAVSYEPSGSKRLPGGGYFYGTDLQNAKAANIISIGADYNHDFGGGVTLTVGGGEWALDSYTAYGGSTTAATDALPGDDAWIATAGGSYTVDGWSFGLQGLYSRWQVWGDAGHDDIWAASLNGTYALGPGISLEGQIAYSRYDANGVFAPGAVPALGPGFFQPANYGAVEIDGGFAINF